MIKRLFALFRESRDSFDGQEVGEETILILRRHYLTILLPLIMLILMALLPLVAWGYIPEKFLDLFRFVIILWFLAIWLVTFYLLMLYILNTVIITNKRIIENEQRGFFNRRHSELHMYRIQDVSTHVRGVIETLFNYGKIAVQTAASEREFVFHQIPNPEKVKNAIMKMSLIHRAGRN